MPNIAPSVVNPVQPAKPKLPPPIQGEERSWPGYDNSVALTVKFGKNAVMIKVPPDGKPDTMRTIHKKFGNIRNVDGQLYEIADLIREYLFDLKEEANI
jgi:hypothetical protein